MSEESKQFPLADLIAPQGFALEPSQLVDPHRIADELATISRAIAPVLDDAGSETFELSELELALTVGAEGGIWFVARGSAEASITLRFRRRDVS